MKRYLTHYMTLDIPDNALHLPPIEDLTGYEELDPLQAFQANNIRTAIEASNLMGIQLIKPEQLKGKVLDFGCGSGGSTWYLSKLGAEATGIDLDAKRIAELSRLRTIPSERVLIGDGLKYMQSLPESSLDLVTAIMIGPDTDGHLLGPFLQEARRVINQDGWVLVNSEIGTLSTLDSLPRGEEGFRLNNNNILFAKGQAEPLPATTDKMLIDFMDKLPPLDYFKGFKG